MSTADEAQELATIHALYERVERDRQAGHVASVSTYQRMFPGQEELVARELEALRGSPAAGGPVDGPQGVDHDPGTLGHYTLLDRIGQGGQGMVYRARDERLGRIVALKVLSPASGLLGDALQRFQREAEVASRLDHPGVCPIYEIDQIQGIPYIAMKYVEGETLADVIERAKGSEASTSAASQRARIDTCVTLIEKTARILHAAHEAGVVHRDVKPRNIVVTPDGEPVILDFGLASDDDHGATLTATGDRFGTPAYMAPEQVDPDGTHADPRTDVWSLGVTLFESLLLQRPFDAPTRERLYHRILQEEVSTHAHSTAHHIPRDLDTIIATALEKTPDRRYQTARDLAEDLRRFREHEPIRARRSGPVARLLKWSRRRPYRAALAALIVVAIPTLSAIAGYVLPPLQEAQAQRQRKDIETELEEGFAALIGLDPANAEASFLNVLAEDEKHVEAIGGLALTYLMPQPRLEEARALLNSHPDLVARFTALQRMLEAAQKNGRWSSVPAPALPRQHEDLEPEDYFLWTVAYHRIYGADGRPHLYRRAVAMMQLANFKRRHEPRALYFAELAWMAAWADDHETCASLRTLIPAHFSDSWYAYVALGIVERESRRLEEACDAFETAATISPRAERLSRRLLAGVHRQRGNIKTAIRLLNDVIEDYPDYGHAWTALHLALMDDNRPKDALDSLERGHQQSVVFPGGAGYRKGQVLEALGRLDEAQKIYEVYGSGSPNRGRRARIGLSRILIRRGDHEAALSRLAEVTRKGGTRFDAAARKLRVRALMAVGEKNEPALDQVEALLVDAPNDAWLTAQRINLLGRLGRWDQFEEHLAAALSRGRKLGPVGRAEIAWALVDPRGNPGQWRPKQALRLARQAETRSKSPLVLDILAWVCHANGLHAAAVAHAEEVVRAMRQNEVFPLTRQYALDRKQLFEEALANQTPPVSETRRPHESHYSRAKALMGHDLPVAIEELRLSAQMVPTFAKAWAALGRALIESGSLGDAADGLHAGLRRVPSARTDTLVELAAELHALGETGVRDAAAVYEQVLMRRPKHTRALTQLARARLELGQPDVALATAREALAHRRNSPGALRQLGLAFAAKGHWERAKRTLENAREHDPGNWDLHLDLADVRARSGDPYGARIALEEAVKNARSDTAGRAHHTLAWFLARPHPDLPPPDTTAATAAVTAAQVAVQHRDCAKYQSTLGIAHYRAGNDQEAIDTLNRAKDLREERGARPSAVDHAFLALAHRRQGHAENARSHFETAKAAVAFWPLDEDQAAAVAEARAQIAGR